MHNFTFQICLNLEKKDSSIYSDKFTHLKFACSVKQFGGRPCNGVLLLTSTGMLCAMLFPPTMSQTSVIITTESLAPIRILIKTADICYGKSKLYYHSLSEINELKNTLLSKLYWLICICFKVQWNLKEKKNHEVHLKTLTYLNKLEIQIWKILSYLHCSLRNSLVHSLWRRIERKRK